MESFKERRRLHGICHQEVGHFLTSTSSKQRPLDDALFDRIFVTNVRGPYAIMRALAPLMKRTGDAQGSIGLLSAFDSEEGTSVWNYGIGQRGWSFRVWARDAEHAVKIANEKRAMLIAQEPAAS